MASISGMYCPSSAVKIVRSPITILVSRRDPFFVPIAPAGRPIRLAQSVARDIPSGLSPVSNSSVSKTTAVEKDPVSLWNRYVDWLYQHKELGLYLDVSRIGFTNEFVERMEPRMQSAFVAMQELEKGAIANPDEGRMVGHYWLRNVALAPNSSLRSQIEKTLSAICEFADKVISAQIKPPSSPHGRFTQVLSVGIGGSALGPQFVAEALAPDNPHLKIRFVDNTDPAGIDHQIAQLGTELASTLVIVTSKSGGTPETRNGLLEVQKAFRDAGLEFPKQVLTSGRMNSSEINVVLTSKPKRRNFIWSLKPEWITGLLQIMTEYVDANMRSAQGFKDSVYQGAAKKMKEKFGIEVTGEQCKNQIRHQRTVWAHIQDLKRKSGVSWDETRKMIVMGQEEYASHIQGVAITQENSLLDNTARIEGWLARFPMFDWVGGRTSEMSAVGLLPAALQGINIREMLVGASLMDMANRTTVLKNNPAALLALCWYWATDGVGSKDMVVLPYKDSLLLFSRYLQQLVMESLGKEFDLDGNRVNQGITVYGNKGSTDQHAYIQQLREGVHNFFVTFIEVLRDRPPGHDWELEPGVTCGDYLFGMLQGTRSALYANDRESITVTVQEVNPRSVGALIALYERAVGIYASLVNINAYHQPGVEAGKKAAGEVLALQKRVLVVLNEASCKEPAEPLTVDEIADRCHEPKQIEMIYKIIAHMAANDRAIIAEGNCGSPRSIKVFLGECNVDELYA